jgi:hypothetical protein
LGLKEGIGEVGKLWELEQKNCHRGAMGKGTGRNGMGMGHGEREEVNRTGKGKGTEMKRWDDGGGNKT